MSKRIVCLVLTLCMLLSAMTLPTLAAGMKSITEVELSSYEKIRFKGETNKDFTQYEVGEEIIFTMTLWGDDEQLSAPYFKCTLTGDDGKSSVEYYDATSGSVTVKTSLSRAGAVRLVVEPCDSSKLVIQADNITIFEGGAMAGASSIQTTVAEPLDFDEYWAGKLAELDECEPKLLALWPMTSNDSNFDAYIVKIDCIGDSSMVATGDTWVTGVLSVPKNASAGSLGFQLHFQGYGVGTVWQVNTEWNVTLSVSAHSIEQCRASDYYADQTSLGLNGYGWSAEQNADPDTSYFTYMLLRDVQALRFLKKYFGEEGCAETVGGVDTSAWKGLWRGDYVQTNGASQGGFQAISVAALDSDVTHVAASIPWFADVAGNTDPSRIQSSFRPPYADGLRYLDTALMAKRVKAGTVWLNGGTGDTLCPMYGVQAIYNNLNTNVSFNFIQGMCHGNTNTIAVTSSQNKSYSEDYNLGTDAIVIKNMPTGDFAADFADAWKALTGKKAVIYEEIPAEISEDALSVLYIADSKNIGELGAMIDSSNADCFGVVLSGNISDYFGDEVKAVLELAASKDSSVHLIGYDEKTLDAGALAEKLSGAFYNNQPMNDVEYIVIDGEGELCSEFIAADETKNLALYPVAYPYYATKSSELSVSYESDTVTLSGKDGAKKISVIDSSTLTACGHTLGAEWIVKDSVMTLYGEYIGSGNGEWNEDMTGVNQIVLSEGVRSLGSGALDVPADALVMTPLTLENIDDNAFCGKTDFSISAYEATAAHTFATENGINFVSEGSLNTCGTDVYWKYADGVLTIFGEGSTVVSGIGGWGPEAAKSSAWYAHYNDITKVVIEGNITTIGAYTFHFMSNLKTVELSENVSCINSAAFENCWGLNTVYIKGNEPVTGVADLSNITSLGGYIFDGVPSVKEYVFSDKLVSPIYAHTFKANSIEEFIAPENLPSIEDMAFSEVSSLTKLTVLGKETVISRYAFADASNGSASTDYIKNITVVSYSESRAHEFAKENGLKFVDIETDELTDYGEQTPGGEAPDGGDEDDNIIRGHITESWQGSSTVDNNWEFDPDTGILTVTSNVNGGWNECGSVHSSGSWASIITEIREVVLVGNMGKLSGNAFIGAVNLEKVTIPAMLGQINYSAFDGCSKLTTVAIEGEPLMDGVVNFYNINGAGNCLAEDSGVFAGASSVKALVLGDVYTDEYPIAESNIPENLEVIYGNTEYLRNFCEEKGFRFIPYGKASTPNVYWTLDESTNTLTLFGSGKLSDLDSSIDAYASSVKNVIIDASITELGDGALSKLTSLEIVSFMGNAPTVAPDAKPFGEQSEDFIVKVKASAEGFDGDTWCGYTLVKQAFIAGDVNEDGTVNIKDAVMLAQYLAGWRVEPNILAADTNGDGSVDIKDAVLLAQYLAGWKVDLVGGSKPAPDPDPAPDDSEGDLKDNEIDAGNVVIS